MPAEKKTNAVRILDRANVRYRLVPYVVDESNLAADHVASQLGEPIERVFKTLVLRGDRTGIFVCVIAGDREVNLKKAAKVSGNKKAEMIHQKELLPLTGYIRGGCTAIGMRKDYPVYFSSEFCDFDRVYVSAGQRGLQLEVPPADFMAVARGTLADITDIKDDEA